MDTLQVAAKGCNSVKFFPVRSCILRSSTFLWHIQYGFYWAQAGPISLSCPCESGRAEAWWTSVLWFVCCCIFFVFFVWGGVFLVVFGFWCFFFKLIAWFFWDRSHLALMFCQPCDILKNFITISGIISISDYFYSQKCMAVLGIFSTFPIPYKHCTENLFYPRLLLCV